MCFKHVLLPHFRNWTEPMRTWRAGRPFEHLKLVFALNALPKGRGFAKAISARFHDEIYLVFLRFGSRWDFSFCGRPLHAVMAWSGA